MEYEAYNRTQRLAERRSMAASARQASLQEDTAYTHARQTITLTILLAAFSAAGAMLSSATTQ
jgi:hypothetical protein